MPLKPPELGFEYVHRKEDGDSLCMGMHNFNLISLAPLPAEVQVQQMLCDPRMHWSQAHLWSLSSATCLAWIKSIMFHNCGQKLSCSEFIFWIDICLHQSTGIMNPYKGKLFQTLLFSWHYYYYIISCFYKKKPPANFMVILIHWLTSPFGHQVGFHP